MKVENSQFTWLHLSDLHCGMSGQKILWPTIKRQFLEDLTRLYEKNGGWDLVIFSGDLTQRGSAEEFSILNDTLNSIWEHFRYLGSNPMLFAVPGNHDLVRPNPTGAICKALEQWWEDDDIKREFWSSPNNEYREAVASYFSNYINWYQELKSSTIPIAPTSSLGLLPGDSSSSLEINGFKIGVVGLNSTWLQLTEKDFKGKIDIDPMQLHGVTNGDSDIWLDKHDINFLITHHPQSWLHQTASSIFDDEINSPNRFTAHFFGHMHESNTEYVSRCGAAIKRAIQAASLFGMEKVSGGIDRTHGYSMGRIIKRDLKSEADLIIWPRSAYHGKGGWKVGPDPEFTLSEDNNISDKIYLRSSLGAGVRHSPTLNYEAFSADDVSSKPILQSLTYTIKPANAHLHIRSVETKTALEAINKFRHLWVVSEWGMGADEFLWTNQYLLSELDFNIFRIDFNDYTTRENFLETFDGKIGCSFEKLCNFLDQTKNSYLIIDDIPIATDLESEGRIESEIEDLVKIVLQFCMSLKVIIRSRRMPINLSSKIVSLNALDEADTRLYVNNHPDREGLYVDEESIGVIYRRTEGVPALIDRDIKDLKVVSLSELSISDFSFSSKYKNKDVPNSLVKALHEIANSPDPEINNAYALLKVLSIFPRGESLERVKRFNRKTIFYANHAHILMERTLIESIRPINVGEQYDDHKVKLVVPRPIRDYVFSLISQNEYKALNEKAIELYFGSSWKVGTIKQNSKFKFEDPQFPSGDIENASAIIQRIIDAAILAGDSRVISLGLDILCYYTAKLAAGSHYREVTNVCHNLFEKIDDKDFSVKINQLKGRYASALRMIDEDYKAKELLLDLKDVYSDKSKKAAVLIDLAMIHESLGENEEALEIANEVKRLSPKSSYSLQADSMILEMSNDSSRIAKLHNLEQMAAKKKRFTIADNIKIEIARDEADPEKKMQCYTEVMERSGAAKNRYNYVRALVMYANTKLEHNHRFTHDDRNKLIRAYHFLYNQRMSVLFNNCHKVLWHIFLQDNSIINLFQLFRHSSLVWRLNGQEDKEKAYIEKIEGFYKTKNFKLPNQDAAYLFGRIEMLKGEGYGD